MTDAIRCGAPACERPAQSDIGPYCTYHLEHPPPPEPATMLREAVCRACGAGAEFLYHHVGCPNGPTALDRDTVVWLALATRSDLELPDAVEQVRALATEVLASRQQIATLTARLAPTPETVERIGRWIDPDFRKPGHETCDSCAIVERHARAALQALRGEG